MGNFYDVVQDKFGNGVSGAIVRLYEPGTSNLKYEVITDSVGRFKIENVESGVYDVKVYSSDNTLLYEQENRFIGDKGIDNNDLIVFPNSGYIFYLIKLYNSNVGIGNGTGYKGWRYKFQAKVSLDDLKRMGNWDLGLFLKVKIFNSLSWSNLRYDDTYNADNIDISVDLGENNFGDFYCLDTATNEVVIHLIAWGFNRDNVLWGTMDYHYGLVDFGEIPPQNGVSDGDIISIEMNNDELKNIGIVMNSGSLIEDYTKGIEKNLTSLYVGPGSELLLTFSSRNSVVYEKLFTVAGYVTDTDDLYNVDNGQVNNTMRVFSILPIDKDRDFEVHYYMNEYGGITMNIKNNSSNTKQVLVMQIG